MTEPFKAQADHDKERRGVASGKTARDLQGIGEHDLDDAGPAGTDDNEAQRWRSTRRSSC